MVYQRFIYEKDMWNILWILFLEIRVIKWGGKSWVGSGVYLVCLGIFWKFFYARKSVW
jgi:hypothetical protein